MSVALGGAVGSMGLVLGCGGGAATATERLWVSGIPTKPTQQLSAFVTMQTGAQKDAQKDAQTEAGRKQDPLLGAFFRGTLYRGGHDVFEWQDTGKDRARIKFLQDGKKAKPIELELKPCAPKDGFHYCLEVEGKTPYAGKYYSRKRWVVRRPGRKRDAAAGLLTHTWLELAEDDADLAHALDAAAEAAGVADE